MDAYVLKYPNGDYVALDEMSGGYPYRTRRLNSIHFWPTAEAANTYRDTGNNKENFTLEKVVALVTEPVVKKVVQQTVFIDP